MIKVSPSCPAESVQEADFSLEKEQKLKLADMIYKPRHQPAAADLFSSIWITNHVSLNTERRGHRLTDECLYEVI